MIEVKDAMADQRTTDEPKKRKFNSSEEGKLAKKLSDHERAKTRITIGEVLPRWRVLKEQQKLRSDTDMVVFLLNW